jgi:putative transcription antitermination factor YqgF
MSQVSASIIGLDIGSKRIGLAKAIWPDGLPSPLVTLNNDQQFFDNLVAIINNENVQLLVAGRPRGLNAQETQQTSYADNFMIEIKQRLTLPLYWVDESLTSIKAEEELKQRKRPYSKEDIDSLSATYILEDFMHEHLGANNVEN